MHFAPKLQYYGLLFIAPRIRLLHCFSFLVFCCSKFLKGKLMTETQHCNQLLKNPARQLLHEDDVTLVGQSPSPPVPFPSASSGAFDEVDCEVITFGRNVEEPRSARLSFRRPSPHHEDTQSLAQGNRPTNHITAYKTSIKRWHFPWRFFSYFFRFVCLPTVYHINCRSGNPSYIMPAKFFRIAAFCFVSFMSRKNVFKS